MLTKTRSTQDAPVAEEIIDEIIPRRQADRRKTSRRHSLPHLFTNEQIKKLRHVDGKEVITHRLNSRRKSERRTSKPKLLSVEEIQMIRKTK